MIWTILEIICFITFWAYLFLSQREIHLLKLESQLYKGMYEAEKLVADDYRHFGNIWCEKAIELKRNANLTREENLKETLDIYLKLAKLDSVLKISDVKCGPILEDEEGEFTDWKVIPIYSNEDGIERLSFEFTINEKSELCEIELLRSMYEYLDNIKVDEYLKNMKEMKIKANLNNTENLFETD